MVSGLESPAAVHCTVQLADHGALPGSPQAADTEDRQTLAECS